MLLAISKTLPPLLFPLGLTILLSLLACVLAFRKGAVRAGVVSLSAAVLLYLASCSAVSQWLLAGLERRHLPGGGNPDVAAIVVLGGSLLPPLPPRTTPETGWAGDRFLHAARLWKRGAAPLLVATGGYIPYIMRSPESEADLYAKLFRELFNVPEEAILTVPDSRTTREDAVFAARLFDEEGLEKTILLVTSASHMPRSVALFRAQGFKVHPAPTDFHAVEGLWVQPYQLLPSGTALAETYIALHEYMGLAVYRMLGWI